MSLDERTNLVDVALVCGGRFHDFDYARLQLLSDLQQWPTVRTSVYSDYSFLMMRPSPQLLLTYTCDLRPTDAEQSALEDYVVGGGCWIALHGTNSVLEIPTSPGKVETPNLLPRMSALLGSRFVSHPPVHEFVVYPTTGDHVLTRGLDEFRVIDELYCSELFEPLEVLLATNFDGPSDSFASPAPSGSERPVLYLKRSGEGVVCYLTLGHCRGLVDTLDLPHIPVTIDHGVWEHEVYRDVLRRCLAWGLGDMVPSSPNTAAPRSR